VTLHTVGHGTLAADDLAELLREAGIMLVVDIRTHPGSRRHPQFNRPAMEQWLPEHGLAYVWEPALGGRRTPRPDSPHAALQVPAFRGYADHMETEEFGNALDRVLAEASARPTAVMCAESLWWRCHRRLVADAAVLLRRERVVHLMHDGRVTEHSPLAEARVEGAHLVYDGGDQRLPQIGEGTDRA
jgi:uncharacterized protein (DUF488 family)